MKTTDGLYREVILLFISNLGNDHKKSWTTKEIKETLTVCIQEVTRNARKDSKAKE